MELNNQSTIVLIGGGIMSATLGVLIKEVLPGAALMIFERLPAVAEESSDAWNNAGTGHAAFCELNYTPQQADGTVDISKAVKIASQFEISKQFWAYLIQQYSFAAPGHFIKPVPHISFVWGDANAAFLKKRFEALTKNKLFAGMQYTEDIATLTSWMPLVMEGREHSKKMAATKMDIGTDVNFGSLTEAMFAHLEKQKDVTVYLNHEVRNLEKMEDGGKKHHYRRPD
jgi:malate dehydrogenase (quinone)